MPTIQHDVNKIYSQSLDANKIYSQSLDANKWHTSFGYQTFQRQIKRIQYDECMLNNICIYIHIFTFNWEMSGVSI